jgi:hypothetical protein
MVTVRLTKRRQLGLACHELKIGSGVDQPSVEEHPAVERGAARSTSAVEGRAQRRSASGGKLRIWRAVSPDKALRAHAQVDIGIFGMGFGRTPGADL